MFNKITFVACLVGFAHAGGLKDPTGGYASPHLRYGYSGTVTTGYNHGNSGYNPGYNVQAGEATSYVNIVKEISSNPSYDGGYASGLSSARPAHASAGLPYASAGLPYASAGLPHSNALDAYAAGNDGTAVWNNAGWSAATNGLPYSGYGANGLIGARLGLENAGYGNNAW